MLDDIVTTHIIIMNFWRFLLTKSVIWDSLPSHNTKVRENQQGDLLATYCEVMEQPKRQLKSITIKSLWAVLGTMFFHNLCRSFRMTRLSG